MALHRRRRIFNGGGLSARSGGREMRRGLLAGLLATTVVGAALLLVLPADLFGRAPAQTGTVSAIARHVAVVDGQTLRLGDAVIRLQGVAAPPRGTACLKPDNSRFDCGAAASEALARQLGGMAVTCKLYGRDGAGFAQGLCEAEGRDLNRGIVAAGWARARSDTPGFAAASFGDEEDAARSARRGLWQGGEASF
ncbi:MAG: thermonuclease family protein [Acetobacteraceae bacterium]|nr:thermonuclease family protein [Acetobacteraceae bacterium]